jgi:hypothetical protein
MSASNKNKTTKKTGKAHSPSGKLNTPLILVGGGILLIVLAAAYIFATNRSPEADATIEVSGAPALKVDKEQIDFGDVKVDTPVSATFEISNVGDQPLRFSKTPIVEVVEGC